MMNSTWLASFLVFAEEVHFTRAAARLHISQPALHVQIAKLTEVVGARLYVRTGRSLELTRAGKELRAFARDLNERSDAFLTGLGAAVVRSIVLAAGEGTLLYRLGPIIRRMSARPDCRVPRGALARPLPELASLDYYVAQRTGLELSKPALDVKAMIRDLARS